ncbi:MAG TPA: ELWxxDGT repeat protein [Thermoanaerobaculia bacterium]|nr:ELWxxDGT repeat protein [Thermoanaerobaculia bacterium]
MPRITSWGFLLVGLISIFASASTVQADGPELVEDIATGPGYYPLGPSQFFTFRGKVLFFASDNYNGPGLWSSDGTAKGTSLLGVLCPLCGNAQVLGATPAVAFFSVQLDSEGPGKLMSIWRTDGTRAGTYPVTGTLRTPAHPQPFLGAVGARLAYFTACTPEQGCEVWSSDGTAEGTGPVVDRVPGTGSFAVDEMAILGDHAYILGRGAASTGLWRADAAAHTVTRVRALHAEPRPRMLTAVGDRLFFLASADGMELWTSDGTTAGTFAASGYAPADPFLATRFLKPIDGRLYFLADDGAHGIELWSVRMTGADLQAVTDFQPHYPFGTDASYSRFVASSLESVAGRLLFAANDGRGFRLWTSRGRPGSLQPLAGFPGGCPQVPTPTQLGRLGSRVVFAGIDDRHGMEPWITDGTGPGTRLVRDLAPGPGYSGVRGFTTVGSRVFFERFIEEREPLEIWATDGTAAGTFFVTLGGGAESHYQPSPLDPHLDFATLGGRTLFTGNDTVQELPQLWVSDGTRTGSRSLLDWRRAAGSSPASLGVFGDHVAFLACNNFLSELWLSGGTAATTVQVDVDLGGCSYPILSNVVDLNGLGVFRLSREYADGAYDGTRIQIWRTDGTAAGTVLITSFQYLAPGPPVPLDGKALFQVTALQSGVQNGTTLWVTDGTAAGTQKRVDLPGLYVFYETGLGSEAFFVGLTEPDQLVSLWRTDGTAAGTFPITGTVAHLGAGFVRPEFTRLGNRIYFLVRRDSEATEIWSTDGTPQGTGPVLTAAHGVAEPDSLWTAGGLLFFRAKEQGGSRRVLWRTDGTPAGTFALGADLSDGIFTPVNAPGFYPSPRFATLGDEVFFQAPDGTHGVELWKSDGTREGTVLVKDIFPGLGGSYPLWPIAIGDRIFFSATNGRHGMELWSSDGTAEGTRRVSDIALGASWSFPDWLTVAGDQLFFAADDGTHGRELWKVTLP